MEFASKWYGKGESDDYWGWVMGTWELLMLSCFLHMFKVCHYKTFLMPFMILHYKHQTSFSYFSFSQILLIVNQWYKPTVMKRSHTWKVVFKWELSSPIPAIPKADKELCENAWIWFPYWSVTITTI